MDDDREVNYVNVDIYWRMGDAHNDINGVRVETTISAETHEDEHTDEITANVAQWLRDNNYPRAGTFIWDYAADQGDI